MKLWRYKYGFLYALFVLILIFSGFFTFQYYKKTLFQFEPKINPIEVLTLILTLLLAFYIPIILENKLTNSRFEKETIIRYLESLLTKFNDINVLVSECVKMNEVSLANETLITSKFSAISIDLYSLKTICDLYRRNFLKDEVKVLINKRKDYKDIVTGGRFQSAGYKYSSECKNREEEAHSKINELLCIGIFSVNRS